MTKQAHITSATEVAVGDKTLALCGKEFKVKTLWSDVPRDKPICRDCVDLALDAMTGADELLQRLRMMALNLQVRTDGLIDAMIPENLGLDLLADERAQWQEKREAKQSEKAKRKRAKTTCTCTWESPENFVEDPNCPIHGSETQREGEGQ